MPVSPNRIAELNSRLAGYEQTGTALDRLRVLEELCRLQPGERKWRLGKGLAQFDAGRVAAAIATLESCDSADHEDPQLDLVLGHAYSAAGRIDEAIARYRKLTGNAADEVADAGYWSLADLKGYAFGDQEIADMQQRARKSDRGRRRRFLLMFALGRAMEQGGRYTEAFEALREGNEELAVSRPYDARGYRALADSLLALRDIPEYESVASVPRPLFIVGMPRSGSTLVEHILASHSQVEAVGELPFIENMARALDCQGGFARALEQLSAEQCREGAQTYIGQVRPFLNGKRQAFVDKWPDNFWYIGLIRALFPEARIINVVRDPLDNAMGVYKQYFHSGNPHSSRIEWIADYWEIYLAVMAHWEWLLPGTLLHFSYERLISEPQARIRSLLAYCGLEFEEQVLRFHESERVVMTPSGSQVRQPLYRTAIGSSKPYQAQLARFLPRFEKIREAADRLLEA